MKDFMKYVDKKMIVSMILAAIIIAVLTMALRRSSNAKAQELANNI